MYPLGIALSILHLFKSDLVLDISALVLEILISRAEMAARSSRSSSLYLSESSRWVFRFLLYINIKLLYNIWIPYPIHLRISRWHTVCRYQDPLQCTDIKILYNIRISRSYTVYRYQDPWQYTNIKILYNIRILRSYTVYGYQDGIQYKDIKIVYSIPISRSLTVYRYQDPIQYTDIKILYSIWISRWYTVYG